VSPMPQQWRTYWRVQVSDVMCCEPPFVQTPCQDQSGCW
jgi:hypothetical protein